MAYVGREMSCYRRGVATSWTVHHARLNVKELTNHASQIYKMYVEFDKYTDGQFKEICMSREAVYKNARNGFGRKTKRIVNKRV